MQRKLKVGIKHYLFTGGGTGGHVYPGIALAEFIHGKEPDSQFLFVGAKGGAEEKIVPASGYPLETLNVVGLPSRRNPLAHTRVLWRLFRAWIRACRILRRSKPHFILGTGGYASAPILLAALFLRSMGLWKGILAVHEQNIVPGRFNLWMSRWVDFTGTSFPETLRFFPKQKAFWTGYLLRKGMERDSLTCPVRRAEERRRLSIPEDSRVMLVFGGSSGARTVNRVLLKSLPSLLAQRNIRIFHATGYPQEDYRPEDEIRMALSDLTDGLGTAKQQYFWQPYFHNIESYYRVADLIVSRAGAGSVWEIASADKPAILIPKSNLPGDHQVKNARFLERKGQALVLYEKRDEVTTQGGEETVDAGAFIQSVLFLLSDVSERHTTKECWRIPEGSSQFYELLQGSYTLKSGDDQRTVPPDSSPLLPVEGSVLREGIEWLQSPVLLKVLEDRWRHGKPIPEDEQRYLENRIDQALLSKRWQERNLGIKLAGLTHYRKRLPFLLGCITDRTPAPLGHRLLGGDFLQVGFIRRNALQAVWRIGIVDHSVRQAILTALDDPYFEVRSWAARAVSRLLDGIGRDAEMEKRLRKNLRDRWFEVVAFTLDPLGELSTDPDIVKDLTPLLENKNWKVQEATVRCLVRLLERGIIEISEDLEQRMRRIPMKGLDFFPLFPLEKAWASFQHRRFQARDSNPELEP